MKKRNVQRSIAAICAAASSVALLAGCGSTNTTASTADPSNTDQTSFEIVGGQSALSPGYNDNEVLHLRSAFCRTDGNSRHR